MSAPEITGEILPPVHMGVDRAQHAAKQFRRPSDVPVVPALRRQQDGLDDDRVHRRHDHAFRVMQPLQVTFGKLRRRRCRTETSLAVARQHVLDDRAALKTVTSPSSNAGTRPIGCTFR